MSATFPRISFRTRGRRVAAPPTTAAPSVPVTRNAFAAYQELSTVCGSATTALNGAPFGPFSGGGSCTYDCDTSRQDWQWSTDYSSLKPAQLLPSIAAVNGYHAFSAAFAPLTQWLTVSLARYTEQLTLQVKQIKNIDFAIKIAGGRVTPDQAAQLRTAFTTAFAQVQQSEDELTSGLRYVAACLSQQNGLIGSLPNLRTTLQTQVDTNITDNLRTFLSTLKCGTAAATTQFNGMKSVMNSSFASLQTPFYNADGQLAVATGKAALIAGAVVNLQSQHHLVSSDLGYAQDLEPVSELRKMWLTIAVDEWSSLVTNARVQLAT